MLAENAANASFLLHYHQVTCLCTVCNQIDVELYIYIITLNEASS